MEPPLPLDGRPSGLKKVRTRHIRSGKQISSSAHRSPHVFEPCVTGFDRYEFKFRPKRSDFGRKKLRTAETAVGFRLSEVVLSPGRRGGKLGGLQQALRRTPVTFSTHTGLIRSQGLLAAG